MVKKVLITGGSFVKDHIWIKKIFPDSDVINLARVAASNRFVSDSVVNSIDVKNPPDFVFIVWSNINYIDLQLPVTESLSTYLDAYRYYGKINEIGYWFNGGDRQTSVLIDNYKNVKSDQWPEITSLREFMDLPLQIQQECYDAGLFWFSPLTLEGRIQNFAMMQYAASRAFNEDLSFNYITSCCTFLDYYKIPYRFTFVENPFGKRFKSFGKLSRTHKLFDRINWKKYIPCTPYEYGVQHNLLESDNYHLTVEGFDQWASHIKNQCAEAEPSTVANWLQQIAAFIQEKKRTRLMNDQTPYIYK